jgi:hypothetical protein
MIFTIGGLHEKAIIHIAGTGNVGQSGGLRILGGCIRWQQQFCSERAE